MARFANKIATSRHQFEKLAIINMFLGSISNRFEVKSCNCEKPSRFSSFPFCPLDDAISFVELSFDIFKLSVYYTHLKDIYGVLKLSPLLYIPKNSEFTGIPFTEMFHQKVMNH